jgi:hypothetical protein
MTTARTHDGQSGWLVPLHGELPDEASLHKSLRKTAALIDLP